MSPILDDPRGAFTGGAPTGYAPDVPKSGGPRTLNLGVVVQPYRSDSETARAVTTANVAKWLEDEYGIMRAFVRVHGDVIQNSLAGSVAGALEALFMGRRIDPFGRGTQAIQQKFRDFINSGEAERVGIPGTPTAAALRGVNHRRKHPYRKSNSRRPSFRDTGLYVASFRSWVS